jgi:hypothetical protein
MTRWLYDCDGDPIGFIQEDNVFTRNGDFAGKLMEDQTVWNGEYVGEIYADDRFVYDTNKLHSSHKIPMMPRLPHFAGEPEFKGIITLPIGYRDVVFR